MFPFPLRCSVRRDKNWAPEEKMMNLELTRTRQSTRILEDWSRESWTAFISHRHWHRCVYTITRARTHTHTVRWLSYWRWKVSTLCTWSCFGWEACWFLERPCSLTESGFPDCWLGQRRLDWSWSLCGRCWVTCFDGLVKGSDLRWQSSEKPDQTGRWTVQAVCGCKDQSLLGWRRGELKRVESTKCRWEYPPGETVSSGRHCEARFLPGAQTLCRVLHNGRWFMTSWAVWIQARRPHGSKWEGRGKAGWGRCLPLESEATRAPCTPWSTGQCSPAQAGAPWIHKGDSGKLMKN